jgi:hypothetical protein
MVVPTLKPHGSVSVVRVWRGICADPILGCFDSPKGLSYGNLLISMVLKLSTWLMV